MSLLSILNPFNWGKPDSVAVLEKPKKLSQKESITLTIANIQAALKRNNFDQVKTHARTLQTKLEKLKDSDAKESIIDATNIILHVDMYNDKKESKEDARNSILTTLSWIQKRNT